jgi:hypothetical protein
MEDARNPLARLPAPPCRDHVQISLVASSPEHSRTRDVVGRGDDRDLSPPAGGGKARGNLSLASGGVGRRTETHGLERGRAGAHVCDPPPGGTVPFGHDKHVRRPGSHQLECFLDPLPVAARPQHDESIHSPRLVARRPRKQEPGSDDPKQAQNERRPRRHPAEADCQPRSFPWTVARAQTGAPRGLAVLDSPGPSEVSAVWIGSRNWSTVTHA